MDLTFIWLLTPLPLVSILVFKDEILNSIKTYIKQPPFFHLIQLSAFTFLIGVTWGIIELAIFTLKKL